ncbi:MAG: hypothetical protein ACI4NE_07130 [Succinivibrio sp.]
MTKANGILIVLAIVSAIAAVAVSALHPSIGEQQNNSSVDVNYLNQFNHQ